MSTFLSNQPGNHTITREHQGFLRGSPAGYVHGVQSAHFHYLAAPTARSTNPFTNFARFNEQEHQPLLSSPNLSDYKISINLTHTGVSQ